MKKNYVSPLVEEFALQAAAVLAASEVKDGNLTYYFTEYDVYE